jgi:hypothetical protein
MGRRHRTKFKASIIRFTCALVLCALAGSIIPLCASCSGAKAETRWYEGKINAAGGLTGNHTITCGTTGKARVSSDGTFKFEGRVNSTAVLRVLDSSGRTTMQAVFPKEKGQSGKSASIDYKTSAVSLVFNRPGIATTDPVAAEVLTRTIAKMPATDQLAGTLEAKSKADPGIVGNPDEDVLAQVSGIISLLKDTADRGTGVEAGVSLPPLTGGTNDTKNQYFQDCDGAANDGVDMRCDYKGNGISAPFNGTNYYSRWVAVYLDPLNEQKEPVQPAEGQDDIPLALLEPRNTELVPSISTLVRISIVDNADGIIEDLLRDDGRPVTEQNVEALKENLLRRTASNAKALYYPTTKDFKAQCAQDKNYMLSAYGPGLAGPEQFGRRDLLPALYTAVTKGILPLIGLALDIPDISPLLAETPAMQRLASKHRDQLLSLLQQSQSGDNNATAYAWASFSQELLQDPEFQQVLGAAFKVGKDAIARLITGGIVKLIPPLDVYDKIAGGANLAIGFVSVAVTVCSLHSCDTYFFSPDGKVADLLQTAPTAKASAAAQSGPIAIFQKFFSALEGGRSSEATSCLYVDSSGQRTVYWGVLGLTNLVGAYRFSDLDYEELSNDGAHSEVRVTGNMSYRDKAGVTETDCAINGTASLSTQAGSWRIVVLPSYTQAVKPVAPPEIKVPLSVPDSLPKVPSFPPK